MELAPFTYEDQQVRVVTIDGEPWFVLADLCRVLDVANPRNVATRLADDMKGVRRVDTPGGAQEMTIVSEAGMYEADRLLMDTVWATYYAGERVA